MMIQQTTSLTHSALRSSRWVAIAVPFAMGLALVFATGFAHPQALHDAAHDARHALSFPCH